MVNAIAELPLLAVIAAFGAAVTVERMTEYILTILFALIKDFKAAWEEKLSGGVKSLLTALFNAGLYGILFRYDFASPTMQAFGVQLDPWQGLVISILIVGGGSNLVHEFFGFFRKNGK